MVAHYLPKALKIFESSTNRYAPFHLMNASVDMVFYGMSVLSAAEFAQALGSPQPEGSIIILSPGKMQQGYGVCTPQDTGLPAHKRAKAVVDQYEHYLATHENLCVDTIAVPGCASSTFGAAAFGKTVAEILQKPVASIVTSGGISDMVGEIFGGMMLGGISQVFNKLDELAHTELRNKKSRDWMREELYGFLEAIPEALTLRTLMARSIFNETDIESETDIENAKLSCRTREGIGACPLKTIVSHSKGNWVVWGALLGVEFLANQLPIANITFQPTKATRPHIDVVTFGCLIDLPHMPDLTELRNIFHYHQFLGTLDNVLGLTQSPYQKTFALGVKGLIDGFGTDHEADPDEGLIPFKGHGLVAASPLHMPIEKMLNDCVVYPHTKEQQLAACSVPASPPHTEPGLSVSGGEDIDSEAGAISQTVTFTTRGSDDHFEA